MSANNFTVAALNSDDTSTLCVQRVLLPQSGQQKSNDAALKIPQVTLIRHISCRRSNATHSRHICEGIKSDAAIKI